MKKLIALGLVAGFLAAAPVAKAIDDTTTEGDPGTRVHHKKKAQVQKPDSTATATPSSGSTGSGGGTTTQEPAK